MPTTDLAALFLERARYYLRTEYPTLLRAAVEALPPDAFWARPNESSNSLGNLLLHLDGNVRQWIVSGVGGMPDSRNRDAEFAARDAGSRDEILARLDATLTEVDQTLGNLSPSTLLERREIQGRDTTVFEAVFHVVEHFSQHLGQIILMAKMHAPGSIQFFEDAGGLARPVWQQLVRR